MRRSFDRERPTCPACGYVHFDDPKVAVGVVLERDGQILLTRRGNEPRVGYWSFPSGFVDAGEMLEEAAAREVREETGLDVAVGRLIGVYSARGDRTVFVAYAGRIEGGELKAGRECMEVAFFPPDALPELAFPHDADVLRAYFSAEPPSTE
jgi:8-oxo-dGTP diphosphatase